MSDLTVALLVVSLLMLDYKIYKLGKRIEELEKKNVASSGCCSTQSIHTL